MIEAMQTWFGALSRREKLLVSTAGGLAAAIIILFVIAMPLLDSIKSKQQEYLAALERRAQIETSIAAMDGETPINYKSDTPLKISIAQSAAEEGFVLDRVDSLTAGTVNIAMARARPQALVKWLNEWEARGVTVQNLYLQAANDGTVSVTGSLQRPTQ